VIYLDYNATTPLLPEIFAEMRPYLERDFGNPSSIHQAGRETRAAVDDSRERIAAVIGAKPHEIIFTSGGTESDNLAVIGLARSHATRGRHLITATTEHHAVLHAFEYLQKHESFRVTWLPVDRFGVIDPGDLRGAIEPETTLVSIMWANNETGTLQPVEELAQLCRERSVLFHSDMIQAFGKLPLNVSEIGCDAIALAAHKFYGPKGAGILYLRSGIPIQRITFGGSHENERRAGTENVPAIVGMAKAAELVSQGIEAEMNRQEKLRDKLWRAIQKLVPGAVLNGHPEQRLANTLNVSFPEIDGETLLINLDLEGICASSGSACMVGSIVPSHVLMAMGATPELARSTVRFSLGKLTTESEIDAVIERLPRIFARLQSELV
jgi:cysteine desulfurase